MMTQFTNPDLNESINYKLEAQLSQEPQSTQETWYQWTVSWSITPMMMSTHITESDVTTPWWHHQMESFSALLALCAGNSPVPVNSPHKGQWRRALMFSLIWVWIIGWINNCEAGDFRCYRSHYDIIVMSQGRQGPVCLIYTQYHGCWLSGHIESQGISSQGTD